MIRAEAEITLARVDDGDEGFSPTATVTKTGDTATITITDKSGTTTETISDGQDGAQGISVISVQTQYCLTNSSVDPPVSGWADAQPAFETGKFYWTRDKITYSNNTIGYSTPVYAQGLTLANEYALDANAKAQEASGFAQTAQTLANSALTSLGTVEDVIGTLEWVQKHGYYQLTQDTSVVANKVYYTVTGTAITSPTGNPSLNIYYERSGDGTSASPYVYAISSDTTVDQQKTYYTVAASTVSDPESNPSESGYYELVFNSALSQYVNSHLALTDEGLTITNDNSTGSMLMSTNGIEIKNAGGVTVGKYGESAIIGAETAGHIEIHNGEIYFYSGAKGTMIPYDPEADPFCVAYISNNELHIPRVVVVESLKMGKWVWDATVDYHLSLVWTD